MAGRSTRSWSTPISPGKWAVAFAALVALVATGCQQKPSERTTDSGKPIVIGISLPLTGDFSQPGGEAKRGYEVWRDLVNAENDANVAGAPQRIALEEPVGHGIVRAGQGGVDGAVQERSELGG